MAPFNWRLHHPIIDYETGHTYWWDQNFVPNEKERNSFIQQEREKRKENVGPLDVASEIAFKPIEPIKQAAEWYSEARKNPIVRAVGTAAGVPEAVAGLSEGASRVGAALDPMSQQPGMDVGVDRLKRFFGNEPAIVEGTKEGIKASGKILTPLDVALLATGMGGANTAGILGRTMRGMTTGLSIADMTAGGVQVAAAETPMETAMGVTRIAGAGVGMKQPHVDQPPGLNRGPFDVNEPRYDSSGRYIGGASAEANRARYTPRPVEPLQTQPVTRQMGTVGEYQGLPSKPPESPFVDESIEEQIPGELFDEPVEDLDSTGMPTFYHSGDSFLKKPGKDAGLHVYENRVTPNREHQPTVVFERTKRFNSPEVTDPGSRWRPLLMLREKKVISDAEWMMVQKKIREGEGPPGYVADLPQATKKARQKYGTDPFISQYGPDYALEIPWAAHLLKEKGMDPALSYKNRYEIPGGIVAAEGQTLSRSRALAAKRLGKEPFEIRDNQITLDEWEQAGGGTSHFVLDPEVLGKGRPMLKKPESGGIIGRNHITGEKATDQLLKDMIEGRRNKPSTRISSEGEMQEGLESLPDSWNPTLQVDVEENYDVVNYQGQTVKTFTDPEKAATYANNKGFNVHNYKGEHVDSTGKPFVKAKGVDTIVAFDTKNPKEWWKDKDSGYVVYNKDNEAVTWYPERQSAQEHASTIGGAFSKHYKGVADIEAPTESLEDVSNPWKNQDDRLGQPDYHDTEDISGGPTKLLQEDLGEVGKLPWEADEEGSTGGQDFEPARKSFWERDRHEQMRLINDAQNKQIWREKSEAVTHLENKGAGRSVVVAAERIENLMKESFKRIKERASMLLNEPELLDMDIDLNWRQGNGAWYAGKRSLQVAGDREYSPKFYPKDAKRYDKIFINPIELAAKYHTNKAFASYMRYIITHEPAHARALHKFGRELEMPGGKLAEIPEEWRTRQAVNQQKRAGVGEHEARLELGQNILEHDPEIQKVAAQIEKMLLENPDIHANLKSQAAIDAANRSAAYEPGATGGQDIPPGGKTEGIPEPVQSRSEAPEKGGSEVEPVKPGDRPAERLSEPLNANLEGSPASKPAPMPTVGKPALEAITRPKNFSEYLTQKFGDRSATKRERISARAEWQAIKEDRQVERLAAKAGIPPEKVKSILKGIPKEESEVNNLGLIRRASQPVLDNFGKVHPWLKERFSHYVEDAERPAMKHIADSYKIQKGLKGKQEREVIRVLDGRQSILEVKDLVVKSAIMDYRKMLDQVWSDAVAVKLVKGGGKRQNYFPHKYAEGWDDSLLRFPDLDKQWNLRDPHLEKQRLSTRADFRKDLGVLDEYFLSAYRRISEVQNFGRRLEILRSFLKKSPLNKPTSDWLHTNIRRVTGREQPKTFDIVSGHARHVQAFTDLGFAAFYQPMQAVNTALYAGFGRSAKAIARVARNYPTEVYDAIRSGSLTPNITQEVIQGAYSAQEGIKSPALQKFMWGIPKVDEWTRVIANTSGKILVEDALKGSKGALKDLKMLGFDTPVKTPEYMDKVGKALSDKALFRTGTLEIPGWASSGAGKLATQYTRFMYRHSIFVTDIFKQAAHGNVRPAARFLAAMGTAIPAMAEIIFPIREGIREEVKQLFSEDDWDQKKVWEEAIGNENSWDEEVQWEHVLRNKRIPWSHPLKRMLQNLSLWGGIGIFQMAIEKGATGGSIFERGGKAIAGPVVTNVAEAIGSATGDVQNIAEDVDEDEIPGKRTAKWATQQIPIVGFPAAKRAFPPTGAAPSRQRRRRR